MKQFIIELENYANEHNVKYGKSKNEYKVVQVSKIKYNKENLLNF